MEPPLSEDGESLSVGIGCRDFVFGVVRLYMDYPTDSPTNDVIVFGIDATFQNKSAADIIYHDDDDEDNNVQDIQEQMMKTYSVEQKEILAVNGVFQHMFSATLKAISMGVLIKEKDILCHYYATLFEKDVKRWYKQHHQVVMMRQKSKFLKEHSKHRREIFSTTSNNTFVKLLHIEDVKRNLSNCLISLLDFDMEHNLQCDVDQMPNHPSYQTVGK